MKRDAIPLDRLPSAEERAMLRDSVRGFLSEHWPVERAVAAAGDAQGLRGLWHQLAAQGLFTLGSDPAEGGLREACVVMEELGRAACPVPFAARVLCNLLRVELPAEAMPAFAFETLAAPATDASVLDAVDGALGASHLLWLQGGQLVLAEDFSAVPARALGGPGWAQVRERTGARPLCDLAAVDAEDAAHIVRLLLVARAHGAARRAFELAVDYAKERQQFGQPIGRFQAVQHKLANNLIALEGARVAFEGAAQAFDTGDAQWRYFCDAAVAFAAEALRRVALENHHAFGAIGYAEEHEAPRHFRRVHLDTLALGGARAARQRLAASWLAGPCQLPAYDLGPAGNAFREEVTQWLRQHWTGERKAAFDRRPFHDREYDEGFARDLGATGWIGLAWPRAFGGQERTPLEQVAFMEVMEQFEAPRVGASVQANALLMHGSAAQRERYLPEILRGEAMHGMGYSEPQAGSDLAALRTSAVRVHDAQGEGWLVNGQKIWTTTWWGRYMFLAARTDATARPAHAGISMFIVTMDAPGITIKPSTTMYDGSFANIFYDDVRLPLDALVGPEGGGWKVLTDALATERGLVGGGIVLKVAHAFEQFCEDVRRDPALAADPVVRERVGTLACEIEVGRRLMIHCAELAAHGATPPEAGAISKVFSGELMERFGEAALEVLGPSAALSQDAPGAVRNGRYEQGLRHSLMWVISIGTNEIQRSLIAQRGLGLPR